MNSLISTIQELWWLAGWIVISLVFYNYLGSGNSAASGVGLFFASVISVTMAAAWLAAMAHCWAKWRWVAWSAAGAAVALASLAVMASQNVPASEARRSRTGAIARDGWVSESTGRGTASHHGGVGQW